MKMLTLLCILYALAIRFLILCVVWNWYGLFVYYKRMLLILKWLSPKLQIPANPPKSFQMLRLKSYLYDSTITSYPYIVRTKYKSRYAIGCRSWIVVYCRQNSLFVIFAPFNWPLSSPFYGWHNVRVNVQDGIGSETLIGNLLLSLI